MKKQYFSRIKQIPLNFKNLVIWVFSVVFTMFTIAPVALATGVYDLPDPNTDNVWVVDTADEISLANENKLTKTFKQLANETGQEIRMVAIRRLDYGETINTLADEIFSTWYGDTDAQANQTLLVMDTLTNNVAIRTGESAKALVNDEIATSVVEETIGYDLRQGNRYNQALIDASDRLVAVLSGQEDPGAPEITNEIQTEGTFTKAEDTDAGSATIWVIGFLIVATIIPMATYYWYVGFGN